MLSYSFNLDTVTTAFNDVDIPFSTRAHWMRRANAALAELDSPCPFAAFATAIVNHTHPGLGELVCIGVNTMVKTGDPTMHGEIAAIRNCTAIMTDPNGPFKLSPSRALAAFADLSLYTNAESCSMCASAIRWAGFREYIFGTSISSLKKFRWEQIQISSQEVFEKSTNLPKHSALIGEVLVNETDPFFQWQYNPDIPCPQGCQRVSKGRCRPIKRT